VLFEKIKSGAYDADDPIWDNVSDGAKDLVEKLLTVDAGARLTADQALAHPWVTGRYWEEAEAAAGGAPAATGEGRGNRRGLGGVTEEGGDERKEEGGG
jgi:hypothetical protein